MVEATGVDVRYAEVGDLVKEVVAVGGLLADEQQEAGPHEVPRKARKGLLGSLSLHRNHPQESVLLIWHWNRSVGRRPGDVEASS